MTGRRFPPSMFPPLALKAPVRHPPFGIMNVHVLPTAKVVSLLPTSNHWPVGVQDVWSRLQPALTAAWEAWAQAADDALFKRSEGAGRGEEAQRFFEAMRVLRRRRPGLERTFWDHLRQQIEAAQAGPVATPRPRPEEATLSLVGDDDLEEGLAIHALAERWRHAGPDQWDALAARWAKLLPTSAPQAAHDLPVGPEAIAEAFRRALSEVEEFEVPVRLVLIKLFERQSEEPLMTALVGINQALASQGLLPNWSARPPRLSRPPVAPPGLAPGAVVSPPAPGYPVGSPALDLLLIETLTQLRPWLAAQQRAILEGAAGADPAQLGAALLERLPQSARRQEHNQAIDQVTKVFGFLLKDSALPTRVQAVLGRLQLPYLRLAVLDPRGFAQPDHPSRLLLDLLAEEGQQWTESDDLANERFEALHATVQRLLESGEEDLNIFLEEQVNWLQRREQAQARQRRREHLAVQTQEGQERRGLAQRAAAQAMADRLADVALPPDVHAVLAHHWGAVLALLWLRHGPESDDYRRAVFVLDQVRFAARRAPAGDPATRHRLLEGVPAQMRRGLALTGLASSDLETLIGRVQTFLAPAPPGSARVELRNETRPPVLAPAVPVATAVPEEPVSLRPEDTDLLVPIRPGTWLEFEHQGQMRRAKLSWISPFSGRWLMVSAKGLKVADLDPSQVAQWLRTGQATVLPDQPLVQRALAVAD